MENVLEVKNLTKKYKDFILENITFSLPKGYVMGFIGPNGAGKSTTIKLLMNLVKRDSGDIKIFGKDNTLDEEKVKQHIGFVYDENYYYDELTARETCRIIAPFYQGWDMNQFKDYLSRFELPENKKLKNFSKGMKTKFALAVALSHGAELIIMDEPTAGLDPIVRNDILDILRDLIQDENKSVLFSSHITADLDKIADFITFINRGRLVFSSSREEIMEYYGIVKGGTELLDGDTRREFIGIRENQYGFEALTDNISKTRDVFGDAVTFQRATLEDIMLLTVRGSVHV